MLTQQGVRSLQAVVDLAGIGCVTLSPRRAAAALAPGRLRRRLGQVARADPLGLQPLGRRYREHGASLHVCAENDHAGREAALERVALALQVVKRVCLGVLYQNSKPIGGLGSAAIPPAGSPHQALHLEVGDLLPRLVQLPLERTETLPQRPHARDHLVLGGFKLACEAAQLVDLPARIAVRRLAGHALNAADARTDRALREDEKDADLAGAVDVR